MWSGLAQLNRIIINKQRVFCNGLTLQVGKSSRKIRCSEKNRVSSLAVKLAISSAVAVNFRRGRPRHCFFTFIKPPITGVKIRPDQWLFSRLVNPRVGWVTWWISCINYHVPGLQFRFGYRVLRQPETNAATCCEVRQRIASDKKKKRKNEKIKKKNEDRFCTRSCIRFASRMACTRIYTYIYIYIYI